MWLALLLLSVVYVAWQKLKGRVPSGFTVAKAMAGTDSVWLIGDSPKTNPMVICAQLIIDRMSAAQLRTIVHDRCCALYPRLKQRVVYANGMPHWETVSALDMSYHVQSASPGALEQNLSGTDTYESTEHDLSAHWSRIWVGQPLDSDKPLWQYQLVERYSADKSAILFRVHHSYGDGISFISFLLGMMDKPKANAADGEHKKGSAGAAAEMSAQVGMRLPPWWQLALGLIVKFPGWFALTVLRAPDRSSLHGRVPLKGERQAAWTGGIKVEDVKQIKNRLGCSFNDVIMSALAGALRKSALAGDQSRKVSDIHASCPISMRANATPGTLDNQFSLVTTCLPAATADPRERVKLTQQRMGALRRSIEPVANYVVFKLFGIVPPVIARNLLLFVADKATTVLTNVPGPDKALSVEGKRIHDLMFWVPSVGTIGLGLSVLSYAGELRVGVTADKSVLSHPKQLLQDFRDELAALAALPTVGAAVAAN